MDQPAPAGILIIDKPLGKTSMDVCANIRWRMRNGGSPKRIKVGHGGTLDPLASGVLVVLVGRATKLQDRVMVGQKVYEAGVNLAHISRTDDREGPIEAVQCDPVTVGRVREVLPRFVGDVMQRPPAYSAMKVGGRRAYALARKAENEADMPKLDPRPVRIDNIEITKFDWPVLELTITCGKGTYIRSLARDIGESLGTGGMLDSLRRTRVGAFDIGSSVTLDDLHEAMTPADLLPIPENLLDQSSSD
ncbi:MAG: tRNA pseudouridine(55) synthase TruB [Phycisphaera sp.]|nr:MAG: tRNA pseudouridine(55) synthase TruB [Phycisphaera sp.]